MYTKEDKRRWLILQCRYYNGEAKAPTPTSENNTALLWDYEMRWVLWNLEDTDDIKMFERDAKIYNLEIAEGDKTPLTMKALLFNRYMHWTGGYKPIEDDIECFEGGFYANYLSKKTNRERRADKRREQLVPQCRLYRGEACNPYMHSKNEEIWCWEKEWVEALSDSYSHRERFFKEFMATGPFHNYSLSQWKDLAHSYNMPATLLACIGKNYGISYQGFKHEMTEDFISFVKEYAKL